MTDHLEIHDWCRETFGPEDLWWNNKGRYYMKLNQFMFRNEHDRTLFLLRWS